jgi:tetratricopeptide (TPR) repeat protein
MSPEEEAWKLALSNQLAEAYTRLFALDSAQSVKSEASALRLYWILSIQPELDSLRSRHHWLAAALSRARLSSPALELYNRELEANPELGLSGPYARLLEVDASWGNLVWLARLRLSMAGLNRLWEVIDADLRILSGRAPSIEEVAWLSFLVAAMAQICFERPAPAYERCRNLISALRHLEYREYWAFGQLEEMENKAETWRGALDVPAAVREVVRNAWTAPAQLWKKSMLSATAWAANDPLTALDKFDQATRNKQCQLVLATFQSLLDNSPVQTVAYPPGLIRGLVRDFLHKNGRGNYMGMRPELLRLLVREVIDPHELVQACELDSALGPRALIEHVRTDPTLRLVWRTIHAPQG